MRCIEFTGKKCYGHLGGKLGVVLFDLLVSQKWIELKEGTSTSYIITETGYEKFAELGLELPKTIINKER